MYFVFELSVYNEPLPSGHADGEPPEGVDDEVAVDAGFVVAELPTLDEVNCVDVFCDPDECSGVFKVWVGDVFDASDVFEVLDEVMVRTCVVLCISFVLVRCFRLSGHEPPGRHGSMLQQPVKPFAQR